VDETKSARKPFDIPKTLIWKADLKVKDNRGAAGVDGQSLAEFEQGLQNNLFKLWNRMSSGSYFPAPVKAVSIPKSGGGARVLGVPALLLWRGGRKRHDRLSRIRQRT
jgi:RNA-directed DNA polymerase